MLAAACAVAAVSSAAENRHGTQPLRSHIVANARTASPIYHVDKSDPPFFVAHSTTEKIPLPQAERFVTKLRDAGVDTEFVKVKGSLHSIAMLNAELKDRIVAFYASKLAAPPISVTQ